MKKFFYISQLAAFLFVSSAGYAYDDGNRKNENALSFGLNMTNGNSETFLSNFSITSKSTSASDEITAGLEANYGTVKITKDDGTKTDDTTVKNGKVYSQYKWLLDELNFFYVNADLSKDDIAEIDYRLQAGPGYGRYLIKNSKALLLVEAGITYIKDKVGGVEDDRAALRLAERFDYALSATSKVWESAEYLPALDDFNKYLLNAEIGIDSAVNTKLSLRVVFQEKINNQPAPGKEKNDSVLIAALGYKF